MSDDAIRLLIAEDDEAMRLLLGLQLEDYADIEVIGAAASGREVVDLCRELAPSAVALDMHLPGGLEGTRLIDQLKTERPTMGIVAYTASAVEGDSVALRDLAVAHVIKGDLPALVDALRQSVGRTSPPAG